MSPDSRTADTGRTPDRGTGEPSPELTVAILLPAGLHPASERPRAARADARAVEMGLRLAEERGARLAAFHAGDGEDPALRAYLGMGLGEIGVLPLAAGADAVPPLAAALAALGPDLVLAGDAAERGEGSGLCPYLLAHELGACLVPGVAGLDGIETTPKSEKRGGERKGEGEDKKNDTGEQGAAGTRRALLRQALAGGKRRALAARLPALLVLDKAAPAPRLSAPGRARDGRLREIAPDSAPPADDLAAAWEQRPAQRRPPRLARAAAGGSALERMMAATGAQSGGGGRLLEDLDPGEAAERILEFLRREGCLPAAAGDAPAETTETTETADEANNSA